MTDSSVCDYIVDLKQGEWEDNLSDWRVMDRVRMGKADPAAYRVINDEILLTDFY